MIEKRADDVSVAFVTPVGEVSEGEANRVLLALEMVHHVSIDVPAAEGSFAFEANPHLSRNTTVLAR